MNETTYKPMTAEELASDWAMHVIESGIPGAPWPDDVMSAEDMRVRIAEVVALIKAASPDANLTIHEATDRSDQPTAQIWMGRRGILITAESATSAHYSNLDSRFFEWGMHYSANEPVRRLVTGMRSPVEKMLAAARADRKSARRSM